MDTSETLTLKLQKLGSSTLMQVITGLVEDSIQPIPQDQHAARYANKLSKEEAGIDWAAPAGAIHRQIRAFYPRSPAYCRYHDQRLRIISAMISSRNYSSLAPGTIAEVVQDSMTVACGTGALEITEVQLEGKTPMSISALLNGHPGFFRNGSLLLSAVTHEQSTK